MFYYSTAISQLSLIINRGVSRTSKTDIVAKVFNGFQPLTIFCKKLHLRFLRGLWIRFWLRATFINFSKFGRWCVRGIRTILWVWWLFIRRGRQLAGRFQWQTCKLLNGSLIIIFKNFFLKKIFATWKICTFKEMNP